MTSEKLDTVKALGLQILSVLVGFLVVWAFLAVVEFVHGSRKPCSYYKQYPAAFIPARCTRNYDPLRDPTP